MIRSQVLATHPAVPMATTIEITSHYRLPARPERTREVLKVFFPAQAEFLLSQLLAGRPARIIAKMNAINEPHVIRALYEASQAGVKIDLIVRGACCLRPGVPGVSDNIRVRSIVGRFLEHHRVYWFANDGEPDLLCSSADWLERNLLHRVETCFPILDEDLAARVYREALQNYLDDNTNAWELDKDGEYHKLSPAEDEWDELNSQHTRLSNAQALMDAAQAAIQSLEDDDSGALRLLAKAQDALQDQTDVEPEFTALVDVLASSLAQAGDVAHSLNAYLGRTELDPARLQTLDDRMSLWMSLARRFKRTPQELPALYQEWKTRLTQLDAATDLEALEATETKAAAAYQTEASKMSCEQ